MGLKKSIANYRTVTQESSYVAALMRIKEEKPISDGNQTELQDQCHNECCGGEGGGLAKQEAALLISCLVSSGGDLQSLESDDVPQHNEQKWKENQKNLICEVVKEQLKTRNIYKLQN
jgi:hypothetical protein